MTAILTGFDDLLSVNMSYEEIDFAERVGEDDIDIDIDLEAAQHDDGDYILEDVHSDAGGEEVVLSNDDVMVDDENVSYPMDDVDILQEEHVDNLQMEDADLPEIPASESIDPGGDTIDDEKAVVFKANLDGSAETVMNELDFQRGHVRELEGEQALEDETLIGDTELSSKRMEHAIFQSTSPIQQNPPSPDYSPSFNSGVGKDDPLDRVVTSEVAAIAGQVEEISVKSSEGGNTILSTNNVIVQYQDAEYALVSTSELDDPDSFFLKNGDLIKESLADMLAGLREVIYDDLGSEDELCLVVEDLGIEITETCVSAREVSFSSIIELYENLLRNDGVETPGRLYVILGTKVDFTKRLANLVTGAADGKGLSELISWDDGSENVEGDDQSVPPEESEETQGTNEKIEGFNEAKLEENLQAGVDSEQNITNATVGAQEPEDYNGEQVPGHHTPTAISGNTSAQDNDRDQHVGDPRQSSANANAPDIVNHLSDIDEDGDLIDYEDEDYEQTRGTSLAAVSVQEVDSSGKHNGNSPDFIEPCLKPAVCFCPACNEDLLIHYEEVNNQLRRHSASTVAEQDESNPPTDANARGGLTIFFGQSPNENANREANDGDDAVGYQHEKQEEDDASAGQQTYENYSQHSDVFQDPYDEVDNQREGEDGNDLEGDITTDARDTYGHEEINHRPEAIKTGDGLDEIDYDPTDANHPIASSMDSHISRTSAVDGYNHDIDEISYEEAGILESNESERTLAVDEPAYNFEVKEPGQIQDEINYESDDEKDSKAPSEPLELNVTLETSPTSNDHTGKRPRVDAEDIIDRALRQPKRARS